MSKKLFILTCFKSREPMRLTTLYHFISGKKTASTLTYAKFYDVLPYYYLLPNLQETEYHHIINEWISDGDLEHVNEKQVLLTEQGWLKIQKNSFFVEGLNHYAYYRIAPVFWERLLFTTQVISETSFGNKVYVPLDANPLNQYRFKGWLRKQALKREELASQLLREWQFFLEPLSEERRQLFVKQLSGHHVTGQTLTQIAETNNEDIFKTYLTFLSLLEERLSVLERDRYTFPLLHSILIDIKDYFRKDTVQTTFDLYQQTKSMEAVARMRGLKQSTITDHLIESSLFLPSHELNLLIPDGIKDSLFSYYEEKPSYKEWTYQACQNKYPEVTFLFFRLFQFYIKETETT